MKLSELDYVLPPDLIAQRPAERRDDSRLLVYDRDSGTVRHGRFSELPEELEPDELVVVNDTRVIPARIRIERPRGEAGAGGRHGDGAGAGIARPRRAAFGPHGSLHQTRVRVPSSRLAADELSPAAFDAARARDGLLRGGGDAPPLPPGDRRALQV